MKIAITGINGYLGQLVLKELEKDPVVDSIVGIDLNEPPPSPKLKFIKSDVRNPGMAKLIEGCDTLLHLAFIVMPLRGKESLIDAINIDGTKNLFQSAHSAGVKRIVYTSSVAAYGAWPDNPLPIKEEWPCRPMPDFYYSRTKAIVENWLDNFEKSAPDISIIRLRPHVFVGPQVDNLTNELFTQKYFISYKGFKQYWQFVWDQDVVDAIHASLKNDLRGAFNLATDDWIPFERGAQIFGKPIKEMPFGVALFFTKILWILRMTRYFHPGWVKCGQYPVIVDNAKAKKELGWQPSKSTHDILLELRKKFNPQ